MHLASGRPGAPAAGRCGLPRGARARRDQGTRVAVTTLPAANCTAAGVGVHRPFGEDRHRRDDRHAEGLVDQLGDVDVDPDVGAGLARDGHGSHHGGAVGAEKSHRRADVGRPRIGQQQERGVVARAAHATFTERPALSEHGDPEGGVRLEPLRRRTGPVHRPLRQHRLGGVHGHADGGIGEQRILELDVDGDPLLGGDLVGPRHRATCRKEIGDGGDGVDSARVGKEQVRVEVRPGRTFGVIPSRRWRLHAGRDAAAVEERVAEVHGALGHARNAEGDCSAEWRLASSGISPPVHVGARHRRPAHDRVTGGPPCTRLSTVAVLANPPGLLRSR